jgi:hypothetical protein
MASDIILNLIQISFIIVCCLLIIGSIYWRLRTRRTTSIMFDNLALRYGGRIETLQPENSVGMERILLTAAENTARSEASA